MSTAKDILEETFSEDMLQAVQDAGVVLTVIPTKDDNGEYEDTLFMGIRPEKEFEDSGAFEYKDVDMSWYWTHSHGIPMPEENANDALVQGLTEMSEKFDRNAFKDEIKEHFNVKMFHGKDLDKCADKAESIMTAAVEAAEKVAEKEKGGKEIE
ncbi:MAG: hypothetical protein IJK26_00165 [Clostridia bacterium]|nr:hypothetical protein [Clostridia bacterium]